MFKGKSACISMLLAASARAQPQAAFAKAHTAKHAGSRETMLEARLEKLEARLARMDAELASAHEAQAHSAEVASEALASAQASAAQASVAAQTATAKSSETATKLAALAAKPQPEGMRVGSTTLKIGGYLKMEAANSHFNNGAVASNSLGRDFYLPQTIPTKSATGHPSTSEDFTAKQTRLWLNLDTQVAGHTVKGYLETDFQTNAGAAATATVGGGGSGTVGIPGGSQRTTNGYTLALRRAFMQVDRFTFGQDWTTFQYTPALPESTDYVGVTEGTVFVRQPLVRYSAPLGNGLTLSLGVENPESAVAATQSSPTTAPAITENGTDHMPDVTARLVWGSKHGEVSLAGLARQVRGESDAGKLVNNGTGITTTGFGGSLAGKLFLNDAKSADLRFMATYGQNIGRYVGLNFAPDAIYVPGTNSLRNVDVFAAFAALRLPLMDKLRANLMGSYQNVHYASGLSLAQDGLFNKRAWSMAGNLFYSPVKQIDLGIEYRHGERTLVNATSGTLDRVEFSAKYNF